MNASPNATGILFVGVEQTQLPYPGKLRAMLPLVDKPALQIAVETLVRLGCKVLHVFIDESPAAVRDFLGNGERWGLELTYHYVDEALSLAGNFKRLAIDPAQACWLGCAERIPQELIRTGGHPAFAGDTAVFHGHPEAPEWSGWAHLSAAFLQTLDTEPNQGALASRLRADQGIIREMQDRPYDLTSEVNYLDSNLRYLAHLTLGKAGQAIVARGARIHPTASITGPIYIGPNARIEADAIIGPNVVIGHDVAVDQTAEVLNSIVLPETYVGRGVFLEEAVVAPGALASIKNQAVIQQIEPHLLASSRRHRTNRSLRSTMGAQLLRVGLFPLYALTRIRNLSNPSGSRPSLRVFRCGPDAGSAEIITLPIGGSAKYAPAHGHGSWSAHFLHTFYPGLAAVAAERIDLFGLELRDVDEIARLPADWQALYHAHAAGLLNEALISHAGTVDANLSYASDACAAAGLPTATKLRILGTYLVNVLRDCSGLCRAPHLAKP